MAASTPRRTQPAQVYRVRRAIAATAVLLLGAAAWRVIGPNDTDGSVATTTSSSSTSTTLPPLPPCSPDADIIVAQDPDEDWDTILVDTQRAIPAGYGPGDLHNISGAGFPQTEGVALRGFVLPDLRAMRDAAEAAGEPIRVLVGYRSHAHQVDLFERRTDELGATEAGSRVARPGHSEHQLGTTIDVTSADLTDVDQSWGASSTGQWIASHAHEFGFILSYPANASGRTCYDYEPWHLRYVGRERAAEVISETLTLREYLWNLEQRGAAAAGSPDATAGGPDAATAGEGDDAR